MSDFARRCPHNAHRLCRLSVSPRRRLRMYSWGRGQSSPDVIANEDRIRLRSPRTVHRAVEYQAILTAPAGSSCAVQVPLAALFGRASPPVGPAPSPGPLGLWVGANVVAHPERICIAPFT